MDNLPTTVSIEIIGREVKMALKGFDTAEQKRLFLYNLLMKHKRQLIEFALQQGVKPLQLDQFLDEGFKGLYDGLDQASLRSQRNLPAHVNLYDWMGIDELFYNLLVIALTLEQLQAFRS
jgi:DNA-damage-inducible protein D